MNCLYAGRKTVLRLYILFSYLLTVRFEAEYDATARLFRKTFLLHLV